MWLCMMSSRGILYRTVLVGWNDLESGLRMKTMTIDFVTVQVPLNNSPLPLGED